MGKDHEQEPYGKPFPFYEMQGTFEGYKAVLEFEFRQEWRNFFDTVLNLPHKEPLDEILTLEDRRA